jgi:hypothetical protein
MGGGYVQVMLPRKEVPLPGPCAEKPQVLMSTIFFIFLAVSGYQFTNNDYQNEFFMV